MQAVTRLAAAGVLRIMDRWLAVFQIHLVVVYRAADEQRSHGDTSWFVGSKQHGSAAVHCESSKCCGDAKNDVTLWERRESRPEKQKALDTDRHRTSG